MSLPPGRVPEEPRDEASRGTPYRIAFVCLGNICRSPMADVVLTELVDAAGLAATVEVSSCGTGDWHVGQPMDDRAAAALVAEGYDPTGHRAQQFSPAWLDRDLVLAMDTQNLRDVGGESERVRMFRSFDPLAGHGLDVPDPYYSGSFEEVLAMVERTCRALVEELQSSRR